MRGNLGGMRSAGKAPHPDRFAVRPLPASGNFFFKKKKKKKKKKRGGGGEVVTSFCRSPSAHATRPPERISGPVFGLIGLLRRRQGGSSVNGWLLRMCEAAELLALLAGDPEQGASAIGTGERPSLRIRRVGEVVGLLLRLARMRRLQQRTGCKRSRALPPVISPSRSPTRNDVPPLWISERM